jgi:L-lactate dehydrogenase complex protein LldF
VTRIGTPGETFEARAHVLLDQPSIGRNLGAALDTMLQTRASLLAGGADLEAMRTAGEQIRAHTISSLADHLEEWSEKAAARGTQVFFADTAAEAVDHIRGICRRRGASLVVKGKSMASEEIGLAEGLEADGIEVLETDLGEYIQQIAGEPPAHIIAPAVHKDRTEVRDLFNEVHGAHLSDEPAQLTAFARQHLRSKFLEADVGITGVNFAIAETGSISIVTNEGNGRMSSSLPPVHVAIMGLERILPSFRELGVMLPLLTLSATGQRVSTYYNVISGPRRQEDPDGPDELHVVVLDNGRSSILPTEYRSILHCIRCGACQNVCPVFRTVGGHAYGSVYGGPIGAVLTPLLQGFERAGDLPHASSLCGACTDICPVRIPLHEHLLSLRRDVALERASALERATFRLWSWAWGSSSRYRLFTRLSKLGQVPFARRGRVRRAPFPLSRWTRGRDLPAMAKRTFRDRWSDRGA